MSKKSVMLHFKGDLVEKPILSGMIKAVDVDINILQASVSPDEDGSMLVQIEGRDEQIEGAIRYLESKGVSMTFPKTNLIWEESFCTHCGACTAHCLPKALCINDGVLNFDDSKCIACELCITACPFKALRSVTSRDHDRRKF